MFGLLRGFGGLRCFLFVCLFFFLGGVFLFSVLVGLLVLGMVLGNFMILAGLVVGFRISDPQKTKPNNETGGFSLRFLLCFVFCVWCSLFGGMCPINYERPTFQGACLLQTEVWG